MVDFYGTKVKSFGWERLTLAGARRIKDGWLGGESGENYTLSLECWRCKTSIIPPCTIFVVRTRNHRIVYCSEKCAKILAEDRARMLNNKK